MSDSRLEKFIYAICSMEVSDLPAPLSRIEKLWNCLITGETPDFEPLSRNEKYLMAMLGLYELDQLPTPMSRGEKLLYKIAVGETDLSDVPGYLSRYEELLKYLIENGGISGGDFEYVLYTLNQSLSTLYSTAEKPVKSAILKGNTLVNTFICEHTLPLSGATISDNTITLDKSQKWSRIELLPSNSLWIPNEKYTTILYDVVGDTSTLNMCSETGNSPVIKTPFTNNKAVFTMGTRQNNNNNRLGYIESTTIVGNETVSFKVSILKGDYSDVDVPYFEGMQSIKMPVLTTVGKNLFDVRTVKKGYTLASTNGLESENVKRYTSDFIYVKGLTDIAITNPQRTQNIWGYDENKQPIIKVTKNPVNGNFVISLPSNITYIRIPIATINRDDITDEIIQNNLVQVEAGRQISSYEPHKSNILTVNEEVTLRGIGDVQDTLNCLTGEVTQRIGEVVLDGSEQIFVYTENDDILTSFGISNVFEESQDINTKLISIANFRFVCYGNKHLYILNVPHSLIGTNKDMLAPERINCFKKYLQQNTIIAQYELATHTIKTVDLTTVDQDGQPTKLKTFNDISHVEINADNLIPSVDVEVATKISETLSTIGPQQLDISNTQNELGQTIEEQTENTDATMMATTEIYEQTL